MYFGAEFLALQLSRTFFEHGFLGVTHDDVDTDYWIHSVGVAHDDDTDC